MSKENRFNVCLKFRKLLQGEQDAIWTSTRQNNGLYLLRMNANVGRSPLQLSRDDQKRDIYKHLFPQVFTQSIESSDFYEQACSYVVNRAAEGLDSTIMVFGQSLTSKTELVQGRRNIEEGGYDDGILQLAMDQISKLGISMRPTMDYSTSVAIFSIHNDTIYDILNDQAELDPSDVVGESPGLTFVPCQAQDVQDLLLDSEIKRSMEHSHLFYKIKISSRVRRLDHRSNSTHVLMRASSLTIADLSGFDSKFLDRSSLGGEANGPEAQKKTSLIELYDTISQLEKNNHVQRLGQQLAIPYASNLLTQVLEPALSGKHIVQFVCTCSPNYSDLNLVLQTFKLANKAQQLRSNPMPNQFYIEESTEASSNPANRFSALPITENDQSSSFNSRNESDFQGFSRSNSTDLNDRHQGVPSEPVNVKRSISEEKMDTEEPLDFELTSKDIVHHFEEVKQPEEMTSFSRQSEHMNESLLKTRVDKMQTELELQKQRIKILQDENFDLSKRVMDRTIQLNTKSKTTQTDLAEHQNDYSIFDQIMANLLGRFPELLEHRIDQQDYMTLFLIFRQMQSDIVQEYKKFQAKASHAQIPPRPVKSQLSKKVTRAKSREGNAHRPASSSFSLRDLVEKSDIFTNSGNPSSFSSRDQDTILTPRSKAKLEELMHFDIENPLDTQKVKEYILKKKEESFQHALHNDNFIEQSKKVTCLEINQQHSMDDETIKRMGTLNSENAKTNMRVSLSVLKRESDSRTPGEDMFDSPFRKVKTSNFKQRPQTQGIVVVNTSVMEKSSNLEESPSKKEIELPPIQKNVENLLSNSDEEEEVRERGISESDIFINEDYIEKNKTPFVQKGKALEGVEEVNHNNASSTIIRPKTQTDYQFKPRPQSTFFNNRNQRKTYVTNPNSPEKQASIHQSQEPLNLKIQPTVTTTIHSPNKNWRILHQMSSEERGNIMVTQLSGSKPATQFFKARNESQEKSTDKIVEGPSQRTSLMPSSPKVPSIAIPTSKRQSDMRNQELVISGSRLQNTKLIEFKMNNNGKHRRTSFNANIPTNGLNSILVTTNLSPPVLHSKGSALPVVAFNDQIEPNVSPQTKLSSKVPELQHSQGQINPFARNASIDHSNKGRPTSGVHIGTALAGGALKKKKKVGSPNKRKLTMQREKISSPANIKIDMMSKMKGTGGVNTDRRTLGVPDLPSVPKSPNSGASAGKKSSSHRKSKVSK